MPPSLTPPIESVGFSTSMLIGPALAFAVLSALSDAVPFTTWLGPFVLSVTGSGQTAIPESPSEQLKLTLTACTYQPLFPSGAAGLTAALIVGGVLSSLKVKVSLPWLPATSLALPVIDWPAVSV